MYSHPSITLYISMYFLVHNEEEKEKIICHFPILFGYQVLVLKLANHSDVCLLVWGFIAVAYYLLDFFCAVLV